MRHRRSELLVLASTLATLGIGAVGIGATAHSSSSPWTSTPAFIGYALLALGGVIFVELLVEWSKVVQRLAWSRQKTAAHDPEPDAQDAPTPEQVRVLDAVASYFRQHGSRPQFKQMSTLLDREGLKLRPVAESMPVGLLLPDVRSRGQFFRDEDALMVTLRGLRYTTDGERLLDLMALVLAYFAERERAITPDAAGVTPDVLVYRDEVVRDVGLSELELEQVRLLISEYEGRIWSSAGSDGNWYFVIDQEAIRDYRGIGTAADYLQAHEGTWTVTAPLVRTDDPEQHRRFTLSWELPNYELGGGPFYLRVHNDGPTCEFEAIAVNVIGAESAPPQWFVRWNQSDQRRQEILSGQDWALMVAEDDAMNGAFDANWRPGWRFHTPTKTIALTPAGLGSIENHYGIPLRVTIRVIPVSDPRAAKENTVTVSITEKGRSILWDHLIV